MFHLVEKKYNEYFQSSLDEVVCWSRRLSTLIRKLYSVGSACSQACLITPLLCIGEATKEAYTAQCSSLDLNVKRLFIREHSFHTFSSKTIVSDLVWT